MSAVILHPGQAKLAIWRSVYRGASIAVDPGCKAAVEAGAATVRAVLAKGEPIYGINTGFGKLASVKIGDADLARLQRNIVLSHAAGVGDALPADVVRLVLALKMASLAQGASGVRWRVIDYLSTFLAGDMLPVIPAQGSVGASGDLAPLAHMSAAFMGVGEVEHNGQRLPAADALMRLRLEPLALGPKEGLALLNGTQVSTALALAGLFDAERVFQSFLVTGALSTDGAKGSDGPFDPRIHRLRRQEGQIVAAEALRQLMASSELRASHLKADDRVQDPYCLRCQPQVMGACLDLLRQAGAVLEREGNAVTDNPLVFAETGDILSGGNFHAEPVAFAADQIAMAICEMGSLAERRIAMLVDPALSRLPAFLTPEPGLNSGFMLAQVTAAALTSENKQRAFPASVDSIPTSANQEDHVSMATHGARRLIRMNANARGIAAIEWLAAVQGLEFHAPLKTSVRLEAAKELLRAKIARYLDDRLFAPDIAEAEAMIKSGALVAAIGDCVLPSL